MPELAKSNGAPRAAVTAVGGVGLGVLVAQAFQGRPELFEKLATTWGAATFLLGGVLLGVGWLVDRHLPPLVQAQVSQADAMRGLSDSIQERFRAEDDVRMATRTLSAQVERLGEKIDRLLEART